MDVGGYFGWETTRGEASLHRGARLALKSGRACLRCLVEFERPTVVWAPYYACDALLEPFLATATRFESYAIDEALEIREPWPHIQRGERLLYVNYFGVKSRYAQALEEHYGDRLWIDNTHAFFHRPANPRAFQFNSGRKFFGVPDGAYLYAPPTVQLPAADSWPRNTDFRVEHLLLREQGRVAEGYPLFQDNERRNGGAIARMSTLSEQIFSHIDYSTAADRRRENYAYLHKHLAAENRLPAAITAISEEPIPFCYPYLPPRPIGQRYFWDEQIFVPVLWRECLTRAENGFAWEKRLSAELLPLPIDHRYGISEMDRILAAIGAHAL